MKRLEAYRAPCGNCVMGAEETPPRRPLRVAFCHYTADVGGGSDYTLRELVARVPRERIEPVLVLKHGDPMAAAYSELGVEVRTFSFHPPRRAFDPIKLLRFTVNVPLAVFAVSRFLRRANIDVVHVNTLFNVQCGLAARVAGRPLLWHVRELMPESKQYARLARIAVRSADRVVANSNAVRDELARYGGHVTVVLNGIDSVRFESAADGGALRAQYGIPTDARVAAVVGRIEPWKGQHVAVDALPAILERCPDAYLIIVGGPAVNKPEYLDALRHRAGQRDIAGRVIFTGRLDDIAPVYDAADAILLTSVAPEPFGRTIVEAMAAGKPVVATRAGGPLDIVRDGETGYFVEPNDADALARATVRVLGASDRGRALGEAGRTVARERFDVQRVAEDMTRLCEAVYTQRSSRRGDAAR